MKIFVQFSRKMKNLNVQTNGFPEVAVTCIIIFVFFCHHMMKSHDNEGLQPEVTCSKGHYLYRYDSSLSYCIPCPPRTFLADSLHSHTECLPCSKPSSRRQERVVRTCSPHSDTILGCQAGYLMNAGSKGSRCARCSNCKRGYHVGRACDGARDTVCCPAPGMTVVRLESGSEECVFMRVETFRQNSDSGSLESNKLSKPEVGHKISQERIRSVLKQWYTKIGNVEMLKVIDAQ